MSVCNCSLTLTCMQVSQEFKELKFMTAQEIKEKAAANRKVIHHRFIDTMKYF
jgi:hypothetical protein